MISPWAVWFGVAFAAFACIEAYAIGTHRIPTLSRTVWRLQARFPIVGFVMGVLVGGLAVHFLGLIPACNP
jgi:hypothetical protein